MVGTPAAPTAILDEFETEVDDQERAAFERVTDKYNLISKIGEGTFSTVYKAEDRLQRQHDYSWIIQRGGDPDADYYVAIKRIYVTSSPARIYNELDILRELSSSQNVLPMITAFRHEDQVYIVLPYFKHPDFRNYYKDLPLRDVRYYMRSLFLALEDVHAVGVIHRDVKPTNFLYDVRGRKGELVDFGLAERLQEPGCCPCQRRSGRSTEQMGMINPTHARLSRVYLKDDQRPSKRANRAGTRGFRAPEVLFKCDNQLTAVDIWSAGVILLTFLTTRFPFFNSVDDIEALVELTGIYGISLMKNAAVQHNCSFETSIPTLHDRPISFTRIVHWSTDVDRKSDSHPESREQEMALTFLERCMTLDPWKRWTARQALEDPFLDAIEADDSRDIELENAAVTTETDNDLGELESAVELDSPMTTKTDVLVHKDVNSVFTNQLDGQEMHGDGTDTRVRSRLIKDPFLQSNEVPDESLHNQMRQQSISHVNHARARREASLDNALPNATLKPPVNARSRSLGQDLDRPTTPLQQILPKTPVPTIFPPHLKASPRVRAVRAKSASPPKTNLTEVATIDPRLTLYNISARFDGA